MEEGDSKSILVKIGIAILVIALVDLFFLNWWVIKNEKLKIKNENSTAQDRDSQVQASPETGLQPQPISSPEADTDIPEGAAGETKTIVEKQTQTVVQTAQKEIFIPIGSGSLKKNTWDDVPGLEVTIDTSKYSAIDSVVFEATLWPDGGNGKAYARLKNETDNNPFVESEISSSSVSGELKTSGKIPIPSGSKKYIVQARSDIENFPAHVENARIKITLK